MELSKPVMATLSEALGKTNLTHTSFNRICEKLEVNLEYINDPVKGYSKEGRLWSLIEYLNGKDKLNKLIEEIIINYNGTENLGEINKALNQSGYSVNKKGQVISYMGTQVKYAKTQSKIEDDLKNLGFFQVLDLLDKGIKEYGEGNAFPSIRIALEGLINEILKAESLSTSGSVRDRMARLLQIDILSTSPNQLRVHGQTIHMELAHSYGIYSLLSHYLNHYNDVSKEELHFVFFQTVGLIWLITQRYLKYLANKN